MGKLASLIRAPTSHASLTWSVPRWSYSSKSLRSARRVLGWQPALRIVTISIAIGTPICIAAKLAFPQLQLGFVWMALLAIPLMFVRVALVVAVSLLDAPSIKVTDGVMEHSHNGSSRKLKRVDLESCQLVFLSAAHALLRFKRQQKSETIGVDLQIDLRLLCELLDPVEVIDKRAAFSRACAMVERHRKRTGDFRLRTPPSQAETVLSPC